jgi:hypothetical protein
MRISMSISCFATVYSVVCTDIWAIWNMLNLTWCMHRMKCMWNIDARYRNCAQWIFAHTARVVRVSCRCDEEEMHSRFRCAENHFTL